MVKKDSFVDPRRKSALSSSSSITSEILAIGVGQGESVRGLVGLSATEGVYKIRALAIPFDYSAPELVLHGEPFFYGSLSALRKNYLDFSAAQKLAVSRALIVGRRVLFLAHEKLGLDNIRQGIVERVLEEVKQRANLVFPNLLRVPIGQDNKDRLSYLFRNMPRRILDLALVEGKFYRSRSVIESSKLTPSVDFRLVCSGYPPWIGEYTGVDSVNFTS